jgi:hypothetical protein
MMTDTDTEEIERLAADRAAIEDQLDQQRREHAKLGSVGTAVCTGFEKQSDTAVLFQYEFPDGGGTATRKLLTDPQAFDEYLDAHGAGSVTDILGAHHDCMYTHEGWQLLGKPSPMHWLRYTRVTDKHVTQIFWPALVAVAVPPITALVAGTLLTTFFDGLMSAFILCMPLMLIASILLGSERVIKRY